MVRSTMLECKSSQASMRLTHNTSLMSLKDSISRNSRVERSPWRNFVMLCGTIVVRGNPAVVGLRGRMRLIISNGTLWKGFTVGTRRRHNQGRGKSSEDSTVRGGEGQGSGSREE